MIDISNKIAVVTGSLGLLGREFCYTLAEAGSSVVVCDIDKKKCADFAAQLGDGHFSQGFDISRKDQVEFSYSKIMEKYGRIDILVNNAAINEKVESSEKTSIEQSKFENLDLEIWNSMWQTNVTGLMLCCQVFSQAMLHQNSGSIVNIASTYGVVAPLQNLYKTDAGEQLYYKSACYPVNKAAVIALTKYLASYFGPTGVCVNALSPGGIENGQSSEFIANYASRTPAGRMAKTTDFRDAILFLANAANSYMTGQNLIVDGGFTIV